MPTPMPTALATISPWTDWDSKMRFAQQLVQTGFLPKAVDTPGKALAIIFAGQEVGVPPMTALRSIDVIQGKPAMNSELKLAIFKQHGGRSKWIRSDSEVAEIWLRHPNGDEHTETFTIEDAKRANLLGKDGWRFYPKAMLRARASAAGLKAVAPDIATGIYDPEELGADVTVDGEIVVPASMPTRAEATPFDGPAEVEPETGRREIPIASADAEPPAATAAEWLDAMTECREVKASHHLEASLKNAWSAYTPEEQKKLLGGREAMRQRLGAPRGPAR